MKFLVIVKICVDQSIIKKKGLLMQVARQVLCCAEPSHFMNIVIWHKTSLDFETARSCIYKLNLRVQCLKSSQFKII